MKTWYKYKALLFIGIISCPLLFTFLGQSNDVAKVENKKSVSVPDWPQSFNEIETYQADLVSYIEEQFGGRATMLKLLSYFKYYIFSESISKRVSVGKNGYVYMNSHDESNANSLFFSICKKDKPRPETMAELISGVAKLAELSRHNNIIDKILIVPTKSMVYPEYLPNEIQAECDQDKQNWIQDWASSQVNVLYPLQELRRWKQDFSVYLPKRFHWIGQLPHKVAEMMAEIWTIEFNNQLFEPQRTDIGSDLKNHLYGLNMSQTAVDYDMSKLVKVCRDDKCFDGFKAHYTNGHLKMYRSDVNNKRLLILSDSFGPHAAKYFVGAFGEVYASNLNNLKRDEEQAFFKWMIQTVQPTHLLYLIHDGGTLWQIKRLNRAL